MLNSNARCLMYLRALNLSYQAQTRGDAWKLYLTSRQNPSPDLKPVSFVQGLLIENNAPTDLVPSLK